jgi:integrase
MATIFPKPDPSNKSVKRWMGKIKVGSNWITVSLRLLANGNKREAQARANDLEMEIKAGMISSASRAWLGEQSFTRLSMLGGRAGAKVTNGNPSGWRACYDAYMVSTNAKDTKSLASGKIKVEDKFKLLRKSRIGIFVKWTESIDLPFMKSPVTDTIKRFIEFRKSKGIKANTLWNGDYTILCCWAEWMFERGICEEPNRKLIREALPDKEVPVVTIPAFDSDLESLRLLHSIRLSDASDGLNWKRALSYWGAWSLVLVIRGLGCRPSEATALSWETVDLENGTVRFIRSKNKKNRRVPILFEWVRVGLLEAWEKAGRPTAGPICTTWQGTYWHKDSAASYLVKRVCAMNKRPQYRLKEAQKLYIAHVIQLGFPPHVVAHWTDHSLSVQEKHYHTADGYLPPEADWDYSEFGKLSEYGHKVKKHVSFLGNDITI